jgi:uncharacterized membrane protein YfcA
MSFFVLSRQENEAYRRETMKNRTLNAIVCRAQTGKGLAKCILSAFIAILSGFCNAAIGAGGGIVLTFILAAFFADAFEDRRAILATTQAAMIPGCFLSALIYYARGGLDLSNFAVFALPALFGGALGSLLLDRIKPGIINTVFSALVIWSGFRMVR